MEITKEQATKLYDIWAADLLTWVEDFLGHFLTSKIPEFHREIYKLVQNEQRLALAAPRGFAKSAICSVFYPLWCALFMKKKDILIISASEGLSIEWLRKMRTEMESNPLLLKYFGDLKSNKWTETHLILNNKQKTNIRARGAGGQIRGFRPDLIILDDIETDESVASTDQRTKLREWVFKACLNTLLPHGQFIWIGTIISPLALLQEMLDSDNDWEKRKFRAYHDARQEEGYELWKSLWSHKKLQARKKEIGSTAFASEYLNDPILNEASPIKPHQLRYWTELPDDLSRVIAVDPAYADDERADYKVAVLVGINGLHSRYLDSYIRTHNPSGQFIDSILNMWLQNKDTVTALGIPNSGTEKEFFNSFMRKAAERHLYPPVVELKNAFKRGTDKVIRKKKDRIVAALQPLFESGKYYIHANHEEAKDELLTLGASRWDDIVDCLTYAETIITPNYIEPEVNKRGRYGELLSDEQEPKIFDYGY